MSCCQQGRDGRLRIGSLDPQPLAKQRVFDLATGEMQRVQQDIEKQTKAAADLGEEARKAGVPSGWIR